MDNKVTRQNCDELGIQLKTVPPYHPQSNPTERSNKTLKTLMQSFLTLNHKKWDEHIDEFTFTINNAVNESTKFTPFFLNYGRHPKSPKTEFDYSAPPPELRRSDPVYWADSILRNLASASQAEAKSYNKGRKAHNYQVGDLVLRKDHFLSSAANSLSGKLFSPYSGPYKIEAKLSENVFELDLSPRSRQIAKTHVRFLKPYVIN